jgi:hypothetical protein
MADVYLSTPTHDNVRRSLGIASTAGQGEYDLRKV